MRSYLLLSIGVLLLSIGSFAQTTTSGNNYNWNTNSTWSTSAVPGATTDVTVNHPLTLDKNLSITSGNYVFNQDVTDQPGNTAYTFSMTGGSLDIKAGTTTIEGVFNLSNSNLYIRNGAVLIIGAPNSTSDNLSIGNKANITLEQGGTLIVYGNILNSNSNGSFSVNGLLQVYGNYTTDNGNIDISGTTGQFYTTGAMTTQGNSSEIYGSSNNCTSNCSGTSLGCGTGGTAYTATIAPQTQTICSGASASQLTFTTNGPSPTYAWEYSLSSGGPYNPAPGVSTNSTYTPTNVTVTTWYRVKYTIQNSSCGSGGSYLYSAPVPVYVSASTFTQSTAGQTLCSGGSFAPISVSASGTGLTYQWYSNTTASNSGGTLISLATNSIYTPQSTTGVMYYYCVINSACNVPFVTAISGAFSSSTNASISSVTGTGSLCVGGTATETANSVVLSGGTGTWSSSNTSVATVSTTGVVTGQGIGTCNIVYTITGGCGGTVSAQLSITVGSSGWNGSVNTDWFNSGNWCGGVPTSSTDVVISNTTNKPVINGTANCKSLTLNANASLSVVTGTLTVANGITVNSTATLTFENNTSLVQTNDSAVNSGNITYKRTTPALKPYDYLYWSSPVSVTFNGTGVPLSQLATDSKFFSFSPTLDNWVSASGTTPMNVGVGYLGRASSNLTTGTQLTTSFYGVPNNGVKNISVSGTSGTPLSYLLGNPYPSSINANAFLTANNSVLSGTLYFWTHNTQISSTSGLYEGDDYAVYNLTGGTIDGVSYSAGGTSAPTGGTALSGYIASGQGFFATSKATGNVVFNDAMRATGNNSQFYRTSATAVEEKSRIWIDLYDNTNGLFKQTLIGYVSGATNEYDDSYDGESLDANPNIDFYSVIEDKNLVVQGRSLPFDNEDIVPLGYRAAIAGDLNISMHQTDGLFLDQEVFVEDKLLNIIHNLKDGAYHFITEEGTFDDRFVLRYTDNSLATNKLNDTKGLAFVSNKKLEVQTSADIKQIDLYDISGKLIKTYLPTLVSNTFENEFNYAKGVYIVKVKTDNDITFTEKLMN